MAAEPYVSKQPGDIIRAGDWNDMQSKARDEIRGHTHTGNADGRRIPRAGIEPGAVDGSLISTDADVSVKSLTTTDLKVNGKAILGDIPDLLATVKGLGNDKVNRAGDTIKGSLTVQQDLTLGNALTVNAGATIKGPLSTADVKVAGSLKTTAAVEFNNGAIRVGLDEGGSGGKSISFLRDANDEGNAGKISYKGGFGSDSLNIVGAGPSNSARLLRIYDSAIVQQDLTVNNSLTTSNLKVNNNATVGTVNLGDAHKMLVPKGAIIMWSGSQVPAGWALCDGNNGTPDLRGRFVLGAGNGNGLTPRGLGQAGGRETQQLSTRELPSHSHGVADPGHYHNWTGNRQQAGTDDNNNTSEFSHGDRGAVDTVSKDTDRRGTGISIYPAGDGQPFDSMPPFYVLSYIMKL
jgi:microcystin-dependent protein